MDTPTATAAYPTAMVRDAATPPTPLGHMLATFDDSLGRLHAVISDLEGRLGPVLSTTGPVEGARPSTDYPGSSEMRNQLADLVARLDAASDRVVTITSRAEV